MFSISFEKHPQRSKPLYQHQVVNVAKDTLAVNRTLEEYSASGWELVGVLDDSSSVKLTGSGVPGLPLFFKKGR